MEARIDPHPPADSLKAFSLGLLGDAPARALLLHLEACPDCRRRAEEASGDDFLARLRQARASDSTPAPAGQVPPLPGVAPPAARASTAPPDPARSLFDASGPTLAPAAGAPAPSDVPPELVANAQYEVIRELGRGGMGVVYLARNRQMGRLEVLKVVNPALLDRPGTVERFLREIRSAAALEHKNVVRAYTYLRSGDLLALVMEYVEGEDLARLVGRRGPLSVASACASIIQAARGLQEAHEKGMVHRDIKPQNLLLSRKLKEVMILDFGLAKVASEKGVEQGLTAEGRMLGTPGYVAPEQILDAATADIRADIYSLGCTLYFLLTGRPPFDAPNLFALLHAHQFTDATALDAARPNVPAALAAVVARMMAKGPAVRYQTPAEVAAALDPFARGGKPASLPAPTGTRKKEATATASLPPPLPAPVQAERVAAPAAKRSPFDLADPPAPAVPRRRKKGRGRLVALALALLVPLLAGVAAVILRVETPNGTLVVEMSDDEVEAKIKGGKLILTGPDGKVRYELSAAERSKRLDAGPYKVRVEGADGLTLDTPEFTLKKGGKVTVRVTVEREAVKDPPTKPEDTKEAPKTAGFVPLFNGKDLTGWTVDENPGNPKQWSVKDGVIDASSPSYHTRNYLLTNADYSDFTLRFEFRIGDDRTHGGLALRADPGERVPFAESKFLFDHPMIKLTNPGRDPKDSTGASHWLRNSAPFTPPVSKPNIVVGKWHQAEVTVRRDTCIASFDGKQAVDIELDPKAPTFRNFVPGLKRLKGKVGFQMNTGNLQFRNIEIKNLENLTAAPPWVYKPVPPSAALEGLKRDQLPPEALALAGDGDPKRAPAGLVGILGEPRPIHAGSVRGLAFSADGKWLASGCTAGTVIIREVATGRVKTGWKGHAGAVLSAAFSKDGQTLATASYDGTVKLWPLDKPDAPRTLNPGLGAIYCMAASADGRFLAAGGTVGGVKLWKWGQWDAPLDLPADPAKPWSAFKGGRNNDSLALSPDGRYLAIRTQETKEDAPVHLFATADGKRVKTLPGKWCGNPAVGYSMAMAFSPSGKYLASFASDKTATVWEVASGAVSADFASAQFGAVAISPDDQKVAVIRDSRFGVEVHDLKTRQKERTLANGVGDGMAVAFSPDGKSLACGFSDGSLHVWDTTRWEEKHLERGHLHHVRSAVFGPDGHSVLSAGDDNTLREWSLKDSGKGRIRRKIESRLNYACFSPDQKKYATSACSVWYDWSQTGVVWDAGNDTQLFAVAPPVGLHSVAFSPDGKLLAGSSWPPPGKTPHVHLWDAETGKEVHRFAHFGDAQHCTPAFSNDGKLLAVASPKQVKVWEVDSCKEVHSWQDDFLCATAFSPDRRTLATGHTNGTITLWDLAAGKKKQTLTGHTAGVKSLKYTPDGRLIVSSGDDGTIRVWDPDWERAKQVIHLGPANQRLVMDIDPSGKYLLAAGHSPVIFILRMPGGEPKAAVEPDAKGFVPLFNGKDLAGWEARKWGPANRREPWKVEDGVLFARFDVFGSWGALLTRRSDYQNFRFRVEMTVTDGDGWSGSMLYLWREGAWHRANIGSATGRDVAETGVIAIGRLRVTPKLPLRFRSREWFTQEVVVEGRRIRVYINGVLTTEHTLADPPQPGRLGITVSGVSTMRIRKMEVKELPETKAGEVR